VFQVALANGGGGATVQNPLSTALTIAGNGNVVASDLRCDYLRANAFVQVGGSSGGYISGPANDTFRFNSIAGLTADLTVEANNTLALRNGVNAQTFNVYNTYTDASNYSRLSIKFGSGQVDLASEVAGTGSGSTFNIGTTHASNIAFYTSNATRWNISGATGHFLANVDNTYDIGANAATRPRSVYAGTSITPGRGVAVASLPTPTTGMIARVTDASAPVIGTTVTGGGAAYALVNYNGANWTVIGV
jgi:hypothetical protein